MKRAISLCVIWSCLTSGADAEAYESPIIDIDPVMECRALAIAHTRVADFQAAFFNEASAQALREQADFAIILGVWGAPLTSVDKATRDMNAGERLLIEKMQLVLRLSSADTGPQGYSERLEECVPVVWNAVKAVTYVMIQSGAKRRRGPQR